MPRARAARLGCRGHRDPRSLSKEAADPHFFRHEYGRLVAVLSRRVGLEHLEAVEDAVQSALLAALDSWRTSGVPDNPPAWLSRVAYHHLVGELRQRLRRSRLAEEHAAGATDSTDDAPTAFLTADVRDDLLRMLFVCCDESIPTESQLVLALKTLCGFDVREIAERLFITEANVYKRLGRARTRLRELPLKTDVVPARLAARLPAVQAILYLMFTEGYLSSHVEGAIRKELCDEAKRLTCILAEHPVGKTPETFALLALMHLHAARMPARQDGSGGLILLEEQDRSLWDRHELSLGLAWLAKSAAGARFSRYHAEAGIAAEHCLAASLGETRWDRIVDCYELLEQVAPSAIHTLNRAVAVAELHGPAEGLAVVERLAAPAWLLGSYLWSAVMADLHRRCGHSELARRYRDAAIGSAPSAAVREALQRRLGVE
jgi:RNA polymerase sigma factor (sigma-70 family)